ncbi:MAG TPA: RDD family protein [Gammaproteobacteria bacterium]|nr:RDD family protein [Gammaproteobacteria bacterium]
MTRRPALWRRLAAAFYDSLVVLALWFVGTALILPLTHGEAVASSNLLAVSAYRLYLLAIGFLFFGGFWIRSGQTLGMLAWKVRVVQSGNGARITWKQALLRYLAALLSWCVFGLGFIWSLFDRERKTWHDSLSGTELRMTVSFSRLSNQQADSR